MDNSISEILVPKSLRLRTLLMEWFKPLYKRMGDFETWVLKSELTQININKPIYVSSLARSGTTIISEMLSEHIDTVHHSYGDFPGVFTPYWNNWIKQRQLIRVDAKSERAHLDRIRINNSSIDAFEEVLWMCFFNNLHRDGLSQTLTYDAKNPFNEYYVSHIKKLLLIKRGCRYLSKANYNSNRIPYILNMFQDAKFIIPIRHPINHIASMNKQHLRFESAALNNKNIDRQLAASGHFEFGNLRQVINFTSDGQAQSIQDRFYQGDDINGWAQYWLYFYQSIINLAEQSPKLKKAIKIIKYQTLVCESINRKLKTMTM